MCDLVIKIRGRIGRNNHRDTAMTHAFRKRFNTILKNNREVNIAVAEKLMGHATKLIPLDTVYHSPSRDVLFIEFRKSTAELSIDDSERLRLENETKQSYL